MRLCVTFTGRVLHVQPVLCTLHKYVYLFNCNRDSVNLDSETVNNLEAELDVALYREMEVVWIF